MDFLRHVIFERFDITDTFTDFASVGSIPDDEEEVEDCEDEDECEEEQEQQQQNNVIRSPSPSPSSTSSSSSQIEDFLKCKMCKERNKNRIMQCSHFICNVCFDAMIEARKNECAGIRAKAKKKREEKILKCPYDMCGKPITDQVTIVSLDF